MIDQNSGTKLRASQTQMFGKRLEWARKRAGFATRKAAIAAFPKNSRIADRSYYAHERGERAPEHEDTVDIYCAVFNVSREFLMFGTGREYDQFNIYQSIESGTPINQQPKEVATNAFHAEGLRYIPIIRASNIQKLLTGEGTLADMSEELLPLPRQMLAGARSFAYEIPNDDVSMVGNEAQSFPPGAHVIVDPEQTIKPNQFVMVWISDWSEPIIRRLRSRHPVSADAPRFPIRLHAINENFETIECKNAGECRILGRVVFTLSAV